MSERSIFLAALDIADPAQRAAYLDGACGNDAALRKHIEELIAAEPKVGGFLVHPHVAVDETGDMAPITERPGTHIGPYKLLQQIGEGGFGVVYMAEQQRPVRRKVALKIIKPGMDTREVIARFESERQALALMDHPNIARVLDAGATESGRPYFVMELVKGVPITEYCDKNSLTTAERLALFITVCHAVQHAHQKGVIHRDLKPSNVMVTLHDGQPVPKVIDFGVSKATSQQLTEKTLFTAYGQMIGTPAYMSPEQAEMSGLDIDTRSDTYSLGVLLYELLTGTTPFDGKRLREAGYVEMQRIIREEAPPRPSTRVSTMGDALTIISNHRSTDPRKLGQQLRGDLDVIVMKAMEKERGRRYDTPNAFAEDIQRFLKQEAIVARPASAAYRLKKFVQRNRATVATGSAIAAALLIGTILSTALAIHALGQRNLADRQRIIAEFAQQEAERQRDAAEKATHAEGQQRQLVEQQKQEAEAARIAERELREAAEEQRRLIEQKQELIGSFVGQLQTAAEQQRRTLYTAQMNLIQSAWASDNIPWMHELLNSVRPRAGQEDLRGFEWHYWNRLSHSDLRTTQLDEDLRASALPVFSANGLRLARYTYGYNADRNYKHMIRVWDTDKGRQIWSLDIPAPSHPTGSGPPVSGELWLSPDSQRVALCLVPRGALNARAPQDLEVRMFDVGSQTPLYTIQEQGFWAFPYGGVVFSRDGLRLAARVTQTGQGDDPAQDAVKVWDARSGQPIAAIALGPLSGSAEERQSNERTGVLAINADGSRVAAYKQGEVTIWDVTSQQVVTQIAVPRTLRLEFSPDGSKLVGRVDATPILERQRLTSDIKIWNTESGAELASFPVNGLIVTLAFSPDGKWLAFLPTSTNAVRSVQLIDADTGNPGPQFKGHSSGVIAVTFSQDSSRLSTAADDGVVKEWDIASPARGLAAVRIPPTSFTTSSGRRVTLPSLVAVSSDATTIATALRPASAALLAQPEEARAATQQIMLRRADDNAVIKTIEMNGPIDRLVSSAGGRRFAAAACSPTGELSEAGQIGVWDAATGQQAMPPLQVPALESVLPSSLSPQPPTAPRPLIRYPPAIALSPDGKYLAYSLFSGTGANSRTALKIVEVDTQRVVAVGESLPGAVFQWLFSPDGSRLLCREGTAFSRKLTVFDGHTARALWSHSGPNEAAAFSTDGTLVYAYTTPEARLRQQGGSIQIWDATTGQPQAPFPVPFGAVGTITIALSPNGKLLASYIADRMGPGASAPEGVQVWDVGTRLLAFTLKGHSAPVTAIAFTPDSRRIATSAGTPATGLLRAGNGETKLWDAQTGQELLQLGEGTNNLAFTADGRQLLGYDEGRGLNIFQLHRWNASPLAPEREAALLVEAFLSKPSGQGLPLKSEALAQIEADASLSESVRNAARQQVRDFSRSASELNQAAWQLVRLPGQARSEYERALRYLEEVLDTDPTSRESWSNRALAHYRLDQPSEALAALARSRELHVAQNFPLPAEDLTILAMTQHQSGRHDEARQSLDKAHAAASRNEPAWRNLFTEAETLLAVASESDASQRWIGRKVMHRPNAGWDVLPIVVSKAEGNLLFTGSRWIEKSQVVPLEDAEAYYTHLLQLEPGNAWAHNLRGFVRAQQGDRDKELEDYNEAIRLSPSGDQGISAFRNRGQWWERKGNVENALRDYEEVIRLDPQDRSAFYRRAGLLQRSGKLDEALKDYDETIRIDPNYTAAYANRGRVWQMKGNLENALKDYDEAIRLNPAYDAAYAYRGVVWRDKGNWDNCLKDFDEAIRLNAKAEWYFANRGLAWQRKGDLDRAIQDYDEVIRLNPKSASTYSERGDVRTQKKEYDKAIRDYDEAIRLDSKSRAWNNKAWLLATCPDDNIRDGKQAIEAATQACEMGEWKNYFQLDTLAAAYAEAGDFEQAVKWQEKVVSMPLPPAERSDSESRLKLYRDGKPYRDLPKVSP